MIGDGELKMTATILFEDFEEEIVLIRDRESFEEEYCMVGAVCRHVKIPLVLYILEKRGNVVNLHRLFLQVLAIGDITLDKIYIVIDLRTICDSDVEHGDIILDEDPL